MHHGSSLSTLAVDLSHCLMAWHQMFAGISRFSYNAESSLIFSSQNVHEHIPILEAMALNMVSLSPSLSFSIAFSKSSAKAQRRMNPQP